MEIVKFVQVAMGIVGIKAVYFFLNSKVFDRIDDDFC